MSALFTFGRRRLAMLCALLVAAAVCVGVLVPVAATADTAKANTPKAGTATKSRPSAQAGPTAVPKKPTLLIYGDSLTVLSEAQTRLFYGDAYDIVFRAQGGTSICDWTAGAAADRAAFQPSRVVIAFTGNAASCSIADLKHRGVDGWLANYRQALLSMRSTFAGVPISVVAAPAVLRPQPAGSWYPENGNPALNALYRQLCSTYGMRYNDLANEWLTPGHLFAWQRPAYPGNGPLTTVRAPDGVHVLPAGALYYGRALGA